MLDPFKHYRLPLEAGLACPLGELGENDRLVGIAVVCVTTNQHIWNGCFFRIILKPRRCRPTLSVRHCLLQRLLLSWPDSFPVIESPAYHAHVEGGLLDPRPRAKRAIIFESYSLQLKIPARVQMADNRGTVNLSISQSHTGLPPFPPNRVRVWTGRHPGRMQTENPCQWCLRYNENKGVPKKKNCTTRICESWHQSAGRLLPSSHLWPYNGRTTPLLIVIVLALSAATHQCPLDLTVGQFNSI